MVAARSLAALALLLAVAGCSGAAETAPAPHAPSTTTSVRTSSPVGDTASPSAAAPPVTVGATGQVPAATAVDDAVAAARAGGLADVDPGLMARVVRGVCAAHLAGLADEQVLDTVRADLPQAGEAGGSQVVRAARTHMCP